MYEVQLPGIKNLKCPELVIATLVLVLDDVPQEPKEHRGLQNINVSEKLQNRTTAGRILGET